MYPSTPHCWTRSGWGIFFRTRATPQETPPQAPQKPGPRSSSRQKWSLGDECERGMKEKGEEDEVYYIMEHHKLDRIDYVIWSLQMSLHVCCSRLLNRNRPVLLVLWTALHFKEVLTYAWLFPRCARRWMRCSIPTRWQSNDELEEKQFKQKYKTQSALGHGSWEQWLVDLGEKWFSFELCTAVQSLS